MAQNTKSPVQQYGTTAAELAAKVGVARQLAVDVTNNTVVVMDGVTAGGHPMAKAAVKIKSGSPNLKVNGGSEATLSQDITITMLPGYVPTGFAFEENPAGQTAGKYLVIKYTDESGNPGQYYVPATILVDIYTGGDGVEVTPDNVIKAKLGAGLKFADGKIALDWDVILDADSMLKIEDGKLTTKPLVSADAGNNLAEGSDGGVYFPADLGSL